MITHWISEIELCSSRPSVFSATLTIVVSRIDITMPRITTPAIFHTYGSIAGRSSPSGALVGLGALTQATLVAGQRFLKSRRRRCYQR